MAKITIIIAAMSMLGYFVCCEPVGSDRDIVYNVVERDTVIVRDTIYPVKSITPEQPDVRQAIVDTLQSYVGVKELTGNNDGPIIEMFLLSADRDPKDREPWCGALITYGFKVNGLPVPKYPALSAAWFDEQHIIPHTQAQKGDLGGLYYDKLKRIGHIVCYTALFVNPTPYVPTVEGNTNAQGSREGNQVANRFRPRSVFHRSANWVDS